ncbi:MAG: peptidylprolyl isomerase [Thermoplasmataceae archaeon]
MQKKSTAKEMRQAVTLDFWQGAMVKEFEKEAFYPKKGEIPGIVKTQYGYRMIKRTG